MLWTSASKLSVSFKELSRRLKDSHSNTQCRRVLESVEDKFLVQVLIIPTRGEVLLNLILTSAEKIAEEVKIGDSLGCRKHVMRLRS